jgi:nitrous oxidase accessory protein
MRTRIPASGLLLVAIVVVMAVTAPREGSVERAASPERTEVFEPAVSRGGFDVPARPVRLDAREIVVGQGSVATLADAVARAQDGDRIVIRGGIHTDVPVVIERSIEIVGEDGAILDGEDREGILTIRAPNVRVRGLTFRNTGVSHVRDHAAVLLEKAHGSVIEGNVFESNFFGIYLAESNDVTVRHNRLRASGTREASSGNGIHLWNVQRAFVHDNVVIGHRDGIYLEFAKSATIRDNVSRENLRYGLHFMFSDSSVYAGNSFEENGAGVAVMYSRNVSMTGNRFARNWGTAAYGLLLKDVSDSAIDDNVFRENTTAILAEGVDRLSFRRNRIERNGWAVKIQANSQDNTFSHNDFVENTFDVVTNSRRSFNTFDRNYWSRYNGYDLSGDGLGDVPFRPVRLFSFIVETKPIAVILIRSFFVDILDVAERVLPVLTPETLIDENPLMRETTI